MNKQSETWYQNYLAWLSFISNYFHKHYKYRELAPLFIDKKILHRSNYISHFPQQIFNVASYQKDFETYLTPAACLHVYHQFQDRRISKFSTLITAHCARFESGEWQLPYRRPDFQMTEIVILGNALYIKQQKKIILALLEKMFQQLEFSGKFVTATDAFFLDQDRGSRIIQQMKELKKEYQVVQNRQAIALASLNHHEDYYGHNFNISTKQGTAHSLCVAFGIERLVSYSLKRWTTQPSKWPKKFKQYAQIF